MTNRSTIVSMLVVFLAVGAAGAQAPQQADEAAARKQAAEQAAREDLNRMAAEQAEAVERARLKVAQEVARAAEAEERERIRRATEVIPIDVEVVISRFQGDKKVSSLPYALSVNATEAANRPTTRLRMGGRVPVPVMAPSLGPDGKPITGLVGGGPVQYEDIGTQIDCNARPLGDGRFDVFISVSDSAVAASPQGTTTGTPPVIRTFQSSNTVVLRDGQTRQFTAASDRITGEVVRVDVTLRVAK